MIQTRKRNQHSGLYIPKYRSYYVIQTKWYLEEKSRTREKFIG